MNTKPIIIKENKIIGNQTKLIQDLIECIIFKFELFLYFEKSIDKISSYLFWILFRLSKLILVLVLYILLHNFSFFKLTKWDINREIKIIDKQIPRNILAIFDIFNEKIKGINIEAKLSANPINV